MSERTPHEDHYTETALKVGDTRGFDRSVIGLLPKLDEATLAHICEHVVDHHDELQAAMDAEAKRRDRPNPWKVRPAPPAPVTSTP